MGVKLTKPELSFYASSLELTVKELRSRVAKLESRLADARARGQPWTPVGPRWRGHFGGRAGGASHGETIEVENARMTVLGEDADVVLEVDLDDADNDPWGPVRLCQCVPGQAGLCQPLNRGISWAGAKLREIAEQGREEATFADPAMESAAQAILTLRSQLSVPTAEATRLRSERDNESCEVKPPGAWRPLKNFEVVPCACGVPSCETCLTVEKRDDHGGAWLLHITNAVHQIHESIYLGQDVEFFRQENV